MATAQGGTSSPDAEHFDETVNIGGSRYAENQTPGMKPGPETAKCDAIFTSKGQPPTVGAAGGLRRHHLWADLDDHGSHRHASALDGEALLPALRTLGRQERPFPWGPMDYSKAGPDQPPSRTSGTISFSPQKFDGADFVRTKQHASNCRCFQPVDHFTPAG